MTDCIFCKICRGEIPARIVYEDDELVAFHDASPQAPVHVLLVPRRHIASLSEIEEGDAILLGRMLLAIRELATQFEIAPGYRVVTNTGSEAGQSVFHLHLHLLGGRRMSWPPG